MLSQSTEEPRRPFLAGPESKTPLVERLLLGALLTKFELTRSATASARPVKPSLTSAARPSKTELRRAGGAGRGAFSFEVKERCRRHSGASR